MCVDNVFGNWCYLSVWIMYVVIGVTCVCLLCVAMSVTCVCELCMW